MSVENYSNGQRNARRQSNRVSMNQTDSLAQLPNLMSYPPQRTRNRMYDRMYDQIYNPPEQARAFLQQARDLRPQVQARALAFGPQDLGISQTRRMGTRGGRKKSKSLKKKRNPIKKKKKPTKKTLQQGGAFVNGAFKTLNRLTNSTGFNDLPFDKLPWRDNPAVPDTNLNKKKTPPGQEEVVPPYGAYVNRKVKRNSGGYGTFLGVVASVKRTWGSSYDEVGAKPPVFTVRYDDGTEQLLLKHELQPILVPEQKPLYPRRHVPLRRQRLRRGIEVK